jgi:dienelactone hydrolase
MARMMQFVRFTANQHLLLLIVGVCLWSSALAQAAPSAPASTLAPYSVASTWPVTADAFGYGAVEASADNVSENVTSAAVTDDCRWQSYTLTDGTLVDTTALLVEPLEACVRKPAPCIVLVHGLGMTKEQMLPVASILASNGYASLIVALPGGGPDALANPPKLATTDDFVAFVRAGLTSGVRALAAGMISISMRPDIDSHRIGLLGFSLGAITGVDFAALEPRIRTVAIVAGGGDLGDVLTFQQKTNVLLGQTFGPLIAATTAAALNQSFADVDPVTYVGRIAPRPLLMENGGDDDIIPPYTADALYAAAKQPKHRDVYAGEGHIPSPFELFPAIHAFLTSTLPVDTAAAKAPEERSH